MTYSNLKVRISVHHPIILLKLSIAGNLEISMTEDQKNIIEPVFSEPISGQLRKPPKDYKPPIQERGEPHQKYLLRLNAHKVVYWDQRNW